MIELASTLEYNTQLDNKASSIMPRIDVLRTTASTPSLGLELKELKILSVAQSGAITEGFTILTGQTVFFFT